MAAPANEFDAAFAQAATEAQAVSPLPHYPSQRYVDKNLAPEKTLTYGDVAALAAARKHAEAAGVLTPELGEHLLPMAMVEGRGLDFGVNGYNSFSPKPATLKRFKDMGLSVTDMTDPKVAEQYKSDYSEPVPTSDGGAKIQHYRNTGMTNDPSNPGGPLVPIRTPVEIPLLGDVVIQHSVTHVPSGDGALMVRKELKGKELHLHGSSDAVENVPLSTAKMMAAVLSEKAAVDPTKTTEGAIKGYNGAGPATEQYLKKVQDAKAMLAHPKNKALMDYFNAEYNRK